MSYEQKALEILRALADIAAAGDSLTIAKDWDFGSATIIDQDGMHTHIGDGFSGDEQRNFEAFVDSLHGLLVEKRGLSWANTSNVQIEGLADHKTWPEPRKFNNRRPQRERLSASPSRMQS